MAWYGASPSKKDCWAMWNILRLLRSQGSQKGWLAAYVDAMVDRTLEGLLHEWGST
jgi:hypothetical protein